MRGAADAGVALLGYRGVLLVGGGEIRQAQRRRRDSAHDMVEPRPHSPLPMAATAASEVKALAPRAMIHERRARRSPRLTGWLSSPTLHANE